MASRMEKYYARQAETKKRSQKNQQLYREMYDMGEYSNIEAVTTLDHTNEIDITAVKQMLKNREDYKRQKEYRSLLRGEEEKKEEKKELQIEEVKNFDIKDALEKLKEEKKEDNTYRSLNNTNYNILKELKIKNDYKKELDKDTQENLKELIDTISSTGLLNKLDNEQLSLNMLEELASTGNTVVDNKNSIEELLKEAKELEQKSEEVTKTKLDNSFYTSSLDFDRKDFEDLYDDDVKKKKGNLNIKITVLVIVIVISIIIGLFVYNFLK